MEFTLDEIIEVVLWVKTRQCRFCGVIATENKPATHEEKCESENIARALRQLHDGRNSNGAAQLNSNTAAECIVPLKRKRTMTPEALAASQINMEKARRARMAKLAAQKQKLKETWNTEVL